MTTFLVYVRQSDHRAVDAAGSREAQEAAAGSLRVVLVTNRQHIARLS